MISRNQVIFWSSPYFLPINKVNGKEQQTKQERMAEDSDPSGIRVLITLSDNEPRAA